MPGITIPHNWSPRWYQEDAWNYLTGGMTPYASNNKHAELVWPRRAGKDEICLHFAAREMLMCPANYWHMLPLKDQVSKAIWNATNPHTGKRRIDEAFPDEVFHKRENDMLIRCKANDATWQCLGSDNYQSAIGSMPRGIVFSEWAQANPSASAYLSPILAENKGWQIYIGTPRGKNHAHETFKLAQETPGMFAQRYTVYDLWHIPIEALVADLKKFCALYGEDAGIAHFQQEYECSWEAATIGTYYGSEMRRVHADGRVADIAHDPRYPVHVAMDIGRTDDFAMTFIQVVGGEVRHIDFIYGSGKDVEEVCSQMTGEQIRIDFVSSASGTDIKVRREGPYRGHEHRSAYRIGKIGIPHDGKAKTFAAKGKSVEEQFAKVFGWDKIYSVPGLSIQDGIQSTRKMLGRSVFDHKCEHLISALEQYHREWDDEAKKLSDRPVHDWSSHPADAERYTAIMWDLEPTLSIAQPARYDTDRTFEEMLKANRKRRLANAE